MRQRCIWCGTDPLYVAYHDSTICYSFMQAIGMVNDHTTDCFRHQELAAVHR